MDGETIGYRMIRPTIANEEDRAKRERLEEARNRLTEEHINPIHIDGIATLNEAVPRLGAPTYADLYRRFGFRLDELADQCRAVLESTEALYEKRPTSCSAPGPASGWRTPSAGTSRGLPARPGTRPSPPRR